MRSMKRAALAAALAGLCAQAAAENITPNLKFNGFATASAGMVSNDQGGGEYLTNVYTDYLGLNEDPNYTLESVIGLQFDYSLNERTNVVAQLVAQGKNYFEVNAEWAYIAYKLNDNFTARAGRFGLPIFMYSDTIYVGESYPWARLPVELYNGIPTTSFTGADLLYRQPLGDNWNLNAQLLTGSSNTPLFYTENALGANVILSNESLSLRVGYTQSDLTNTTPGTLGTPLEITDSKAAFINAGSLYDDGNWFLAGEFGQLKLDNWLSDWNAGYLSAGHYFGKWLPYVLASKMHTFNEDECMATGICVIPGVQNLLAANYLDQTTYAVGAKYAVSSGFSIKGQVDKVYPRNGSNGFLYYQDNPNTASPVNESLQAHNPGSFYVFTLALTAAF